MSAKCLEELAHSLSCTTLGDGVAKPREVDGSRSSTLMISPGSLVLEDSVLCPQLVTTRLAVIVDEAAYPTIPHREANPTSFSGIQLFPILNLNIGVELP